MTVRGIDISNHQNAKGPIDYRRVATQVEFVYAKATQGTTYRDPYFPANRNGFSHLLPFGGYLWLAPGDGAKQAKVFTSYVGELQAGELPPMVDIEEDGCTGREAFRCVEVLEDFYQCKPFLYGGANPAYRKPLYECVREEPTLASLPLWVASYRSWLTRWLGPGPIGPWSRWTVWQYTSSETIAGIVGPVDANQFNGTFADLNGYRVAITPPPVHLPNGVLPMYSPPLRPIAAACPGPRGQGALAVAEDGSVYILGDAPVLVSPGWVIGPQGQSYWGDRRAAQITFDDLSGQWTVTATSGERYSYPHA